MNNFLKEIIKTLLLVLCFSSTNVQGQLDYSFIKTEYTNKIIPNKFLETDSLIYGIYAISSNFEEEKSDFEDVDIFQFNKYSDELIIHTINYKRLKGLQILDLFKVNNKLFGIFSKDDNENILLYKAEINFENKEFNEVIEIGKMPYTKFTTANTYSSARDFDKIQNIYCSRSIDNNSIVFYTYLKDKGRNIHVNYMNENLEQKWANTFDIKDKWFFFGSIKEITPLPNGEVILSMKNHNNKTKFYIINEAGSELEEISTNFLDHVITKSKIISTKMHSYLISVYEKNNIAKKLRGINIVSIHHDTKERKSLDIVKEFESNDANNFQIISTIINDSKIHVVLEQDLLYENIEIGSVIFISIDKDLQSYTITPLLKKQLPMTTNLGGFFSIQPICKSDSIIFIQNTNEKFRTNYNGKDIINYGAGLKEFETSIVSLTNDKITFDKMKGLDGYLLSTRSATNMNDSTLIFSYKEPPNGDTRHIGILRY
jgi:hypothetical protein